MNTEEIKSFLERSSDDDLYYLLRDVLNRRRVEYYLSSADEYGWPTIQAKLAVIKQILCA